VGEVTAGKRYHVKCCDDTIQSTNRHDMVWCKCGKSAIDGGADYIRFVGDWSNFELAVGECSLPECTHPAQHPGQPCEFCHKEIGVGG
jgi:hypothetical protein